MRHIRTFKCLGSLLLVTACVTVNVYFPAAAAEKAADRIIKEIYGVEEQDGEIEAAPPVDDQSSNTMQPGNVFAVRLLDFLVPVAYAQQPNIDISTPAIRKLKASMTQRHNRLKPFYNNGAVGMDNNGLIKMRDPKAVSIKQRNTVKQLISAENRDRNALYKEIAKANGHPEWENDIRGTFARRWIANAPAKWYFQDTRGGWTPN